MLFAPFPHNSSTRLDPLDLRVFGVVEQTFNKITTLLAELFSSNREMTLDLATMRVMRTFTNAPALVRAQGLESVLSTRNMILITEWIFLTKFDNSRTIQLQALADAGLQPFDPTVVLSRCFLHAHSLLIECYVFL